MADEAQIVELLGYQKGRPIRMAINDATEVKKGTLMVLDRFTEREVLKSSGGMGMGNRPFGVAAHDKVANDGQTEISVYTHGLFMMRVQDYDVTAGRKTHTGGTNRIEESYDLSDNYRSSFGIALTSGGSGDWVLVFLGGL